MMTKTGEEEKRRKSSSICREEGGEGRDGGREG